MIIKSILYSLLLCLVCIINIQSAKADYQSDMLRYQCDREKKVLRLWMEHKDNEPGTYFDHEFEGSYNPSELVNWKKQYRLSSPSSKSPIKKKCSIGNHTFIIEIRPGHICQDGVIPDISLYIDGTLLINKEALGGTCSITNTSWIDSIVGNERLLDITRREWRWHGK